MKHVALSFYGRSPLTVGSGGPLKPPLFGRPDCYLIFWNTFTSCIALVSYTISDAESKYEVIWGRLLLASDEIVVINLGAWRC